VAVPLGKPVPRPVAIVGRILWTFGGLGMIPLGPGTFGTVAGVGIALLATRHPGHEQMIVLASACVITLLGTPLATLAERVEGKDPRTFVWDEVAGYLVTMLGLPLRENAMLCVVGGFFAFRIFDILKPWPIRSIEEKPGGIAVMADDIVAGLYANIVLRIALFTLPYL
jgi:phosphatidylglycerophosphatase A